MVQIPREERRVLEKGFENCNSLWVKYLKLMVSSARFYTFFLGSSLVYVKCLLLNHTYLFVKNFILVFWVVQ